jgi:hypothetical protein
MRKLIPRSCYSSFIAIFLSALGLMPAAGVDSKPVSAACLQGTFIQLLDAPAAWK